MKQLANRFFKQCLIILFLISFAHGFAQDTIVFNDGTTELAKIERITDDEVDYKMWNYLEGPTRVKKISSIQMIKYANGLKETFSHKPSIDRKNVESEHKHVYTPGGEIYDNRLVVTSGSYKVLRENECALVEFDLSNISWEGEESFESKCGDEYQKRIKLSEEQFINSFNSYSKGLFLYDEEQECKYKVLLKIEWLGQFHRSFCKMYMVCRGDFVVSDLKTGETVCAIRISDLAGDADCDMNDRLKKCFDALAYQLSILKRNASFESNGRIVH